MAFLLSVFLGLHLIIYLSSADPSMAVERNFIQHCRASSITTVYLCFIRSVLALEVRLELQQLHERPPTIAQPVRLILMQWEGLEAQCSAHLLHAA
jgi:hypothetical protein